MKRFGAILSAIATFCTVALVPVSDTMIMSPEGDAVFSGMLRDHIALIGIPADGHKAQQ